MSTHSFNTEAVEAPREARAAGPAAPLGGAALLAYRTPLQEHSVSADGKAASVLTTLGLLFTILSRYAATIADSFEHDRVLGKVLAVLIGAFAVLAVLAVVQAFRTISPRFPRAERSLAFFGDIVRMDREAYLAEVRGMSDEEAMGHILNFNHTVSLIIVEKFRQLARCLRLFRYAFVAWLAAAAVLTIRAVAYG